MNKDTSRAGRRTSRMPGDEKLEEMIAIALVFALMTAWIFIMGSRIAGPDEEMRYDIAEWFYQHSSGLPCGYDPGLLNSTWGFSYAYYPYLAYMIGGLFMKLVSVFTTSPLALLRAARMASCLFVTIGAYFTIRTGKELFGRRKGMLYACLIIFMPAYHYLGTYVNVDSLALMAVSVIVYAWARTLQDGWTWKNCMILAAGMGICMLSYYNAYGWVLFSFFFFVLSILFCHEGTRKERITFLLKRGIAVAAVTLAICGWFFIHNAVIYHGDILGRSISSYYSEIYAAKGFKPSDHFTPQGAGWSLWHFITYQDPGWAHNWLIDSLLSFFGVFGIFNVYMPETVSKIYFFITWIGMLGMLFTLRSFAWRRRKVTVSREVTQTADLRQTRIVRTVERENKYRPEGIFNLCMIGAVVISFLIFFDYAYTVDIQSQGRYFEPAVYGVMYFAVYGYMTLMTKLKAGDRVKDWFCRLLSLAWVMMAVFNFFLVIVPYYA